MTSVRFEVPRPLTDYEMADIQQAIDNILAAKSFFYAGDGDLGDEIRMFLVDHPIDSNLELVEGDGG
jgi:hypothetical protein